MSDLIERDKAIEAVQRCCPDTSMYRAIRDIPSVESNRGEWIPCSERLPEDDELMLVTYIDRREEAMPIWIGWHEMENVWYIDGDAHCEEIGNEVIAWMPLPKPYGERKDQ